MKILTGNSIKKLDAYTIEHEPIESLDLMERAAERITEAIVQRWDASTPVVIFAGPGNNGGDALAVARMLALKGYELDVYLINMSNGLSENCNANRELLESLPEVKFLNVTKPFAAPKLTRKHLVIDGLFGSGLNKPLSGAYAAVINFLNKSEATIVSIDIPSGLMSEDNSYNNLNNVIQADLTLSIQLPKLAFFFAENERFVGEWKLLNIGLSQEFILEEECDFELQTRKGLKGILKPRPRFSHKGNFGHALLVAGSKGMAGASVLAARACLRSGVGLLTVHAPFCNIPVLQSTVPEAMTDGDIDEQVFAIAPLTDDYQAVGVGPGLGQAEETKDALMELLENCAVPCVIDADAINLLAQNKEMLKKLPQGSILTPHPKELERLVGKCNDSYERLNRSLELAKNTNCYLVLKGCMTAILTPAGKCYFNPNGNPGMATAGSGDVLTGIITALLAQGYSSLEAARLGVYAHGLAGDLASEETGEMSLIASDIITYLPKAWKTLCELD